MSDVNDAPAAVEGALSVSIERIAPILKQASAAGLTADDLAAALDMAPASFAICDRGVILLADYYRLQNYVSGALGDETLRLSSRQLLPGSTDFVLQSLKNCSSLYEAMQMIARSYNLLHGGQFNHVTKTPVGVDYIIDDRAFPYAAQQSEEHIYFSIECTLIFLHCILMIMSPSAKGAVLSLRVRRPTPGGPCRHLGYWDAPIRFGAKTYVISFDRGKALARLERPASDITAAAVHQQILKAVVGDGAARAAANSFTARVRDALAQGVVEQADIARLSNVSVATLRRRLNAEGASFRDLRRDVLNHSAKRMLISDRPIPDIAEALGFSEFRAFNRAFKKWNGITPKAYMRKYRV